MASRREFLNSFRRPLTKGEEVLEIVRPPYGLSQSIFQSECIRCEDKACVASCDEQIIVVKDGTPKVDFSKSGCAFCEDCAKVCSLNVLDLTHTNTDDKLNAIFKISLDNCVAHHGVICFSCKEPCIDNAILFNGLFNPIIDDNKCTACGFCLSRCPTEAISYNPIQLNKIEEKIS